MEARIETSERSLRWSASSGVGRRPPARLAVVACLALLWAPAISLAEDEKTTVFLLNGLASAAPGHTLTGLCGGTDVPGWSAFEVVTEMFSTHGKRVGMMVVCGNQQGVSPPSPIRESALVDIVERGEFVFLLENPAQSGPLKGLLRIPYRAYDIRVAQLCDGGDVEEPVIECSAVSPCPGERSCVYPFATSPDNLRMTSVVSQSVGAPIEAEGKLSAVTSVKVRLLFEGFVDTRIEGTVTMVGMDGDDGDDDDDDD